MRRNSQTSHQDGVGVFTGIGDERVDGLWIKSGKWIPVRRELRPENVTTPVHWPLKMRRHVK
ncbi:hypothetical protein [Acetobacter nitrogenifigens]